MKKGFILALFFCLCITLYQGNAEAVLGIPDNVQSATLIVPLMEKAISGFQNTLTVVDSLCLSPVTIHYELWDIDGAPVDIFGNVTFIGSWVTDFGTLLGGASPGQLAQVTDGSFYHGFMTVDVVTAPTILLPTDVGYPFSGANCLTGWVYYVRLLEGAANGIPMVHIEGGVDPLLDQNVRGFYQFDDDREEIDNHARHYAYLTTNGLAIVDDPDNKIDYTISRVFLSGNGESRIVLWAWAPAQYGSTTVPSDITGPFQYWHFNQSGTLIVNSSVSLTHVVNIINVAGSQDGQVWINDIPENFNVYAFSFNSAFFTGNPALTWEAMFESTILHEWLP